jgi:SAM-dependent methyltransferase
LNLKGSEKASGGVQENLMRLYSHRFAGNRGYRNQVWAILAREFFSRWIPTDASILDLGAGYGEFINNVRAARKYAMDLNPDAAANVSGPATFLLHDCSTPWPMGESALDVVFTSNFLEHLPDKGALLATLREAWRCLRPGGCVIAVGPNIKRLPGQYWDFFDHHVALSEASLAEALIISGFELETVVDRFLPYTMVNSPEYPLLFLRAYLAIPFAWRIFGRQFLVVARRPTA